MLTAEQKRKILELHQSGFRSEFISVFQDKPHWVDSLPLLEQPSYISLLVGFTVPGIAEKYGPIEKNVSSEMRFANAINRDYGPEIRNLLDPQHYSGTDVRKYLIPAAILGALLLLR